MNQFPRPHEDQHDPAQHPHPPHHGHPPHPHGPPAKWHSYKVLVDPIIHRGAPKLVRYDGIIVPGDAHHIPPNPTDPRTRLPNSLWKRLESMELPVPKFKVRISASVLPP
jgi:histone-lysine N-methyltransferase SETD1